MKIENSSIAQLVDAVKSQNITAVKVTEHFLSRIEKLNPVLNAFISVSKTALEEAHAVDKQVKMGKDPGILAGIPIAIKDLLCTKGLKTTSASKILDSFIPPYDATVVRRLKAAGAIIIGKTNLDEFAMGSSNETSAAGPCKNPWNPRYVPGGSSGGSASAMAARLSSGAIGTDTGGSIRQPSSFCGLYGMKPTYGRVSRYGIIAYASSLDQAGPMANSTQDCALILEAIAGKCDHDSTTSDEPVPLWSKNLTANLAGMTIGLPKEYFKEDLNPEVRAVCERAISTLKERGATFIDVSLPLVKYAVPAYYLVATSEASSNLARYDGIRFGHRHKQKTGEAIQLDDLYALSRTEGFGAEVKRRIMLGTYCLSSGYYEAYYQKACQVRRLLREEFMRAFSKVDLLFSPVTASSAFTLGERIKDPIKMYLNDFFTTSTNLSGLPGMSVPGGFIAEGMPIGVQLTAKHFQEQKIFNAAYALETHLVKEERVPNVI